METQHRFIKHLLHDGKPFLVKEIHHFGKLNTRPFKVDGGGICICTTGTAEISVNTETYTLKPGCEIILLSESSLFIKRYSENFLMTVFLYSKEVSSQALHKFDPSFFRFIDHCPIYEHTNGSEQTTLSYMNILNSLQHDVQNQFSAIMAINLLRCIMLNIYDKVKRCGENNEHIFKTRKEDIFSKFMNLINEHGRKHRDVAFYANKLCISPRYLSEVTKTIANESPKQFIDYHLISEMKLLLTFSEMSIQQMADYLHFPDQSYLGRFFKRHTAFSPLAYRMQELGR